MRRKSKSALLIASLSLIAPIITSSANASLAPQAPESSEPLGTAKSNEADSEGMTAEVNNVERNDSGNMISVSWSIANNNDDYVTLTWLYDQSYTYTGDYFSGVTAVSSSSNTRFHPVMDGSGECLCAGNTSSDFFHEVAPEGKSAYWSLFSTPSDVDSIDLEVPGFEPIEDIPID